MWRRQKISLLVLLALATVEGRPIALHNYAPAHEYQEPSSYSFSYGVKDLHTGDVKHQWEKKDGDTVRGHYSVLEPDGSVRTVDYTVDGKKGFNAVVKHSPSSNHPKIVSHNVVQQPPDTHFTTLQESIKTEYQIEDGGNNQIKHFVFVPEDEEGKASIKNRIKIPAPNYVQEYQKTVPLTSKLPVDLHLVKQTTEKIIPIDVSQLSPVEIDLSQQLPKELTSEELSKFLQEYYQSGLENLNLPQLETGFQPIKPQMTVAQTFKTNKKPASTPGLRNYSTNPKHRFRSGSLQPRRSTSVRLKKN